MPKAKGAVMTSDTMPTICPARSPKNPKGHEFCIGCFSTRCSNTTQSVMHVIVYSVVDLGWGVTVFYRVTALVACKNAEVFSALLELALPADFSATRNTKQKRGLPSSMRWHRRYRLSRGPSM